VLELAALLQQSGWEVKAIKFSYVKHEITASHSLTIQKVYERSSGDNELGAAIHLAPNCNGILRRFGIFPENFGANSMDSLAEYDDKGSIKFRQDLTEKNKMWQHPWQLCNRVRLHRALRDAAMDPTRPGEPVTIIYNSKVVEVDSLAGQVKLQDGTRVTGDVILGADGVHVSQSLSPGTMTRELTHRVSHILEPAS
jgi:2-polyprenyl-6-methoxyphenol hydroxylase-like FAD-dependent oxidoreductase